MDLPIAEIPEYLQRLLTERDDVDFKIQKLVSFMNEPKFPKLRIAERTLMRSQLSAMTDYLAILNQRIALYETEVH